jgi:hypothetical protein
LFYEVTKAARERGVGEPTSLRQMEALVRVVKGSTEERVAHWLSMAGDGVEVTTRGIQDSVSGGHDDGIAENGQQGQEAEQLATEQLANFERLRQEAVERAEKALEEKKAAAKRAKDRLEEINKLKSAQKEREKAISTMPAIG